jgi:peroxiredoxin
VEQPALEKVWREYGARGVKFVGINFRDSKTGARAFVDEFDVTYPSIFNPDAELAGPFRLRTPPSTFVLDDRGRIAARIIGPTESPAELRAVIDKVLGA